MPIYEYRCPQGHVTEKIRSYVGRDDFVACQCGHPAPRIEISRTHVEPDGMYSYCPDIGDKRAFERRQQMLKDGVKVYKKEAD